MKITATLLLACCLHATAHSFSQGISLSEQNTPLQTVFKHIERQSGYVFFFDNSGLDNAKPVTMDAQGVSLETALGLCFKGQPFTWSIVGKTVVVRASPVTPQPTDSPPPGEVRGRVLDSLGNPLTGATVTVKGKNVGTYTDANGDFRLENIPEKTVLVFSYVGYEKREVRVTNSGPFDVVLRRSNDPLDAVQIIAYGTNTPRYNLGSVSSVTSEDIEKQPVTNVLQALEGRIPGLAMTSTSGAPGAAVNLQIRGQNTLSSGGAFGLPPFDQPLFIVDGVPFAPQNQITNVFATIAQPYNPYQASPQNDQMVNNAGLSPFNSINPADIERIDVLKDADATSIYGSQGANGVILITTKRGKPGPVKLDIRASSGVSVATRTVAMMNTPQYLAMRREAVINDGMGGVLVPPGSANPGNRGFLPDLLVFDTTKNTDWAKQFFGGSAKNTDVHVGLSGGTANTTFNVAGGYTRATYNFPGGSADNRLSASAGFHHNSPDRRITIDFNAYYSYDQNDARGGPNALSAFTMAPDHPNLVDGHGNLVWTYNGVDVQTNPFAYLREPTNVQNYDLNSNLRVGYRILPGLNLAASLGYSNFSSNQYLAYPYAAEDPAENYNGTYANFIKTGSGSIIIEPQATYQKNIGLGKLDVLVGGTYKKDISDQLTLTGSGYSSDGLLGSINGASYIAATTKSTDYKYDAAFGRISYNWDGTYLVNFTGRRDGSSNFGPGRQFGNFWSAGAGWIFSEEHSVKRALPFLSFGKIRASYGTTGTDGVAPYQYQPNWGSPGNTYNTPYQNIVGIQALNLYNPDYGWAVNKKLEFGLDLGFLKDRLLIGAAVYQNRCGNQLVQYTLPWTTGFTGVTANLPALVQNRGLEITVTSTNIKTARFTWTSSFNISFQQNRLLAFPGLAISPYANFYFIGQPVNTRLGEKYAGLDSTGAYQFVQGSGGYTSNPNFNVAAKNGGDGYFLPNTDPKYFGGLNNAFFYKNFSFSFFIRFNKQVGQNYLNNIYYNGTFPGQMANMPAAMAGHFWQAPGDKAPYAKLSTYANTNYNNLQLGSILFPYSDAAYSDASYIRCENVSLSYTLSSAILRKVKVRGANIYINEENLFTITGYKVGDPETRNIYGIPTQRTVVAGISFSF